MDIIKIREETDRSVIKFGDEAFIVIKKYNIIKRALEGMDLARPHVPVPKVLLHGESAAGVGYMITQAVHGEAAETKLSKEGYQDILKSLRKIRTTEHGTVKEYVAKKFDKIKQTVEDKTFNEFIDEVFLGIDWDNYSMCLNHGDLHLGNIIADDTGKAVGVLDWEYATFAPEFTEEVIAWLYEQSIVDKIECYDEAIVFTALIIHIFTSRPNIIASCLSMMNSLLAQRKTAQTKPPSGMDTALNTLLAPLVNKIRENM